MVFLTNPVIFILISFCNSLVCGDTHETLAKRSVTGKPYYLKTSTQLPEIYDTVHSVVFEFTTPNWTRPINLIGYTCTGDDYETDGWSCPILWYWLTGVRDKIQELIYVDNMKIPDLSKFPTDFNCDELRQVFDGLFLNEASRSEFLSFITSPNNCQSEQTTVLLRSDKYLANGIDAPYRTMREKFFEEYYSLQTPLNRSNDAMYTNARYNFYSSGLFDYYIESRRWTEALSECKSGRIPSTLITPPELAVILNLIATNASLNGMELVIGADKLSIYYKLEGIVDCAFTPDSAIVVLQVPLKFIGSAKVEHIEFTPVPYFNDKGQVCSLDLENNRKYLVKSSDLVLVEDLHCHKSGFCRLESEVEMKFEAKSCPQVLFEEDDDSRACKARCRNRKAFRLPMTSKVADDRVLIFGAGGNKNKVKIVCPDFQKMELINSTRAVEVTLPCGCEIHRDGKTIFKTRGTKCGGEVHVIQV